MRKRRTVWGFKSSPIEIKGKSPQQLQSHARMFYDQLDCLRGDMGVHYRYAHNHRQRNLPDVLTAGSPDFDSHLIVAAKQFLKNLKGRTACDFGSGYGTLVNALQREGMECTGIEKETEQQGVTKQFAMGAVSHGVNAASKKSIRQALGRKQFDLTTSSSVFQSNALTQKQALSAVRNIAAATAKDGYSIHFVGNRLGSYSILPIEEFEKNGLKLVEERTVYGRDHDPMLQKSRAKSAEPLEVVPAKLATIISAKLYIFQKVR